MMIVVVLVIKTIIQNNQSYRSKDKKKRILLQEYKQRKESIDQSYLSPCPLRSGKKGRKLMIFASV
jgi:hypothetical protein